ncbi:MAG TPA: hypothetical protein VFU43_13945 [Streptosporangiaceae bacterium]|nr:hypothetical protein [Streptosporangiaceae bacterium]
MNDFHAALIEEATKKSGVLWLALPGLPRPRAAWHIWYEGAAYVLTGGEGEQPLPGLPESEQVTVIVGSKDKGVRLVTWVAEVTEIEPETDEWDAVVPVLARERLNGDQEQAARWARDSYIIRLAPTGEATTDHPADYAAVRPVPTPATTTAKRPFMIGAKHRKADR